MRSAMHHAAFQRAADQHILLDANGSWNVASITVLVRELQAVIIIIIISDFPAAGPAHIERIGEGMRVVH